MAQSQIALRHRPHDQSRTFPLRRAVVGYHAWISAIRRDQTNHRAVAGVVQWDPKFDLVKVNKSLRRG